MAPFWFADAKVVKLLNLANKKKRKSTDNATLY